MTALAFDPDLTAADIAWPDTADTAGADFAWSDTAWSDTAWSDTASSDTASSNTAGPDMTTNRSTGRSVLDSGTVSVADLVRPVADLARRAGPPLSVLGPLAPVLPLGLRRGSTVAVTRSISLLLALLGGPSSEGAWCALVGLPPVSAEAAAEYGIDLARLAIVPAPGPGWLTAVGALLDAVDIVVVRPPVRVSDGDLSRLGARVRGRDAVLVPYLAGRSRWPRADVELDLSNEQWAGLGSGHGRLRGRQVTVHATGRGQAARPRSTTCWLPAATGGIDHLQTVAATVTLHPDRGPSHAAHPHAAHPHAAHPGYRDVAPILRAG